MPIFDDARATYTDIFDDGFSSFDSNVVIKPYSESLALRTLLAHTISGNRLHIPEQWFCSSPAALLSLSIYVKAYRQVYSVDEDGAPLIGVFLRRNSGGNPLVTALHARMCDYRRLRLDPSIFIDSKGRFGDRMVPAREVLSGVLNGEIHPADLASRLVAAGVPEAIAEAIETLAQYFDRPERVGIVIDSALTAANRDYVAAVAKVLALRGGAASQETLVHDLVHAMEKGRLAGIQSQQSVDLLQYVRDNAAPSVAILGESLGRAAMHAHMGRWLRATNVSISSPTIAHDDPAAVVADALLPQLLATARVSHFRAEEAPPIDHRVGRDVSPDGLTSALELPPRAWGNIFISAFHLLKRAGRNRLPVFDEPYELRFEKGQARVFETKYRFFADFVGDMEKDIRDLEISLQGGSLAIGSKKFQDLGLGSVGAASNVVSAALSTNPLAAIIVAGVGALSTVPRLWTDSEPATGGRAKLSRELGKIHNCLIDQRKQPSAP